MIAIIFGILAMVFSVLLVLIVLVQNSKGGGLSSAFGASNISSMIGARRATQDVEKFTWYLIGALMFAAFVANVATPTNEIALKKSRMSNQIEGQSLQLNQTSLPSGGGEEE
ncbi:MAG: preprotein translocase subunit SecG [Bacteroidia bacterium]|nr:preprotein translocase subunit SecG [Bacteroidia bacterium]